MILMSPFQLEILYGSMILIVKTSESYTASSTSVSYDFAEEIYLFVIVSFFFLIGSEVQSNSHKILLC